MPTVPAKPEGWQLELSAPQPQVRPARELCLFGCVRMVPCVECAFSGMPKTCDLDVNIPDNCAAAVCSRIPF